MLSGQPFLNSLAVVGDVEVGPSFQSLGGGDASVVVASHLDGGEIGVGAGTIPIDDT